MKQVIDGHNKAILKNAQNPEENQPKKMCNCRNEKECPLEGELAIIISHPTSPSGIIVLLKTPTKSR